MSLVLISNLLPRSAHAPISRVLSTGAHVKSLKKEQEDKCTCIHICITCIFYYFAVLIINFMIVLDFKCMIKNEPALEGMLSNSLNEPLCWYISHTFFIINWSSWDDNDDTSCCSSELPCWEFIILTPMCILVSSPDSTSGNGLGNGSHAPWRLQNVYCQNYLDMYLDSHVFDSYVNIISINSLVSMYFQFSRSIECNIPNFCQS